MRRVDVMVIGAGHAGCEAAHAAARLGSSTMMVTPRLDRIGWMSCNPAIGGIGKGHLVREIDALGGIMARAVDATGIQFRTLNVRRGPAVRGSRAQCDRALYAQAVRAMIEAEPRVELLEDLVEELVVERSAGGSRVVGVRTARGDEVIAGAVVVTTGTFLNGMAFIGEERFPCGREGDPPAIGLSRSLEGAGLALGRFKTGTTPRLDGRTIDYEVLSSQPGDEPPKPFSHWTDVSRFPSQPQVECHIARTNPRTHEVVRANLSRSRVYDGNDKVVPTRYCPSLEDKVTRFAGRGGHRVYLEPEGLHSEEVYPAGLSTSLPAEVQLEMLRTIEGMSEVEIVRPGYAIEYDYVNPHQVNCFLEAREVGGLFLAGQVLGTSGYEEAAAQGLIAGVNASRCTRGLDPLLLGRDEAYLGVLVDDLTGGGTTEPYRMFTSRAEHRLLLREDNADFRLSEIGMEIGLLSRDQLQRVRERERMVEGEVQRLERTRIGAGPGTGRGVRTLATVLRRPGVTYADVGGQVSDEAADLTARDQESVESLIKYKGYVARLDRRLERVRELEDVAIPRDLDLSGVPGLSREVREKMEWHRPSTLGQARRISGVTPAAVEILSAVLVGRRGGCG